MRESLSVVGNLLTQVSARSGRWLQVGRRESKFGQAYGGDADFAESEVEHPPIRTHEETGHEHLLQ